jgi:hypothetical protein
MARQELTKQFWEIFSAKHSLVKVIKSQAGQTNTKVRDTDILI